MLNSRGWQFVVLVTILSIVPYYFILQAEDSDSPFTLLLMWVPSVAALILRLYRKEGVFKGMFWNPAKDWKWIFVAAFVPLIIEILSLLSTYFLGGAEFKQDFLSIDNGIVSVKGVAMIFGAAPQPWYLLIWNYLLSYFVGALFYSLLFALGEEYGWRGYLQKKWAPDSNLKGLVAIGCVWGLWHLPAILQGHNYPEYPILGGFILMPLLCTLFSIVFGIAMNRSRVIWIAVVFHGALNISADVSNTAFDEATLNRPINDAIWTTLWLVTALIFWYNIKKRNNDGVHI